MALDDLDNGRPGMRVEVNATLLYARRCWGGGGGGEGGREGREGGWRGGFDGGGVGEGGRGRGGRRRRWKGWRGRGGGIRVDVNANHFTIHE